MSFKDCRYKLKYYQSFEHAIKLHFHMVHKYAFIVHCYCNICSGAGTDGAARQRSLRSATQPIYPDKTARPVRPQHYSLDLNFQKRSRVGRMNARAATPQE